MIYGSATLLLCCWRGGGVAALLRIGYLFTHVHENPNNYKYKYVYIHKCIDIYVYVSKAQQSCEPATAPAAK